MKHYKDNHEGMILRDFLAIDRTKLANERTLLGYVRTSLSLLLSGIGFIQFVDASAIKYLGIALCLAAPIFLAIGTYKYLSLKKQINKLN